jgi:hypothetical protein
MARKITRNACTLLHYCQDKYSAKSLQSRTETAPVCKITAIYHYALPVATPEIPPVSQK